MMGKLSKNLIGLVVGIVFLTLFAGMADAGDYGCYGSSYGISEELQSWSKKIDTKKRFVVLKQFNCEAVLDKETQLVWEKSPSTDHMTWYKAIDHCYTLVVGGRGGFRLPTVEELASLLDTNQINPALPSGHPFEIVQQPAYWSASTSAASADAPADAFYVDFTSGVVIFWWKGTDGPIYVWCVRGGHGHDAY